MTTLNLERPEGGSDSEGAAAARGTRKQERTCAGCGKHAPAGDLVRVVHDPSSGEVAVDLAASGFGRGAHVHPAPVCVAKALKGGLARVFKAKVVGDPSALAAELVSAADRRIEGLLSGARRAGQLAIGADVAARALQEERANLVVIARDAAAALRIPEVERAIAAGKAVAFGDKQRLGALLGGTADEPKEVAVIAVLHAGVAAAVEKTYRISGPFRSTGEHAGAADALAPAKADERRSEEAWSSSSEVR